MYVVGWKGQGECFFPSHDCDRELNRNPEDKSATLASSTVTYQRFLQDFPMNCKENKALKSLFFDWNKWNIFLTSVLTIHAVLSMNNSSFPIVCFSFFLCVFICLLCTFWKEALKCRIAHNKKQKCLMVVNMKQVRSELTVWTILKHLLRLPLDFWISVFICLCQYFVQTRMVKKTCCITTEFFGVF